MTNPGSKALLVVGALAAATASGCSKASNGAGAGATDVPHTAASSPMEHASRASPVLELRLVVVTDGTAFRDRHGRTLVLAREVAVSTCDVEEAGVVRNEVATPGGEVAHVAIRLSPSASLRFERFTTEHLKQRVAIVVDGKIVSAPVVQAAIPGGHISVDAESMEEAVDLERRLRERAGCAGK